MFSILLHIYNEESWDDYLRSYLKNLKGLDFYLLINISSSSLFNAALKNKISEDFPSAFIVETPDTGRDIGAKFVLIDLLLELQTGTKYVVLLHDKKSPHAVTGDRWREQLFKIIEPGKITTILDILEKKRNVGLIGAREFLKDEYDPRNKKFAINDSALSDLQKTYNIYPDDYSYVAGTMFWIRLGILRDFFSKYSLLQSRAMLEKGNVMDMNQYSTTHAWERAFCWLTTAAGYKIQGV